jgi:hypothetical protein
MIKDAEGRKWFMRFKQYRRGWYWEARHGNAGQGSGQGFKTKALAEDHARRVIQGHDAFAHAKEYFRRVRERGAPCQLTTEGHEAITRAGANKPERKVSNRT